MGGVETRKLVVTVVLNSWFREHLYTILSYDFHGQRENACPHYEIPRSVTKLKEGLGEGRVCQASVCLKKTCFLQPLTEKNHLNMDRTGHFHVSGRDKSHISSAKVPSCFAYWSSEGICTALGLHGWSTKMTEISTALIRIISPYCSIPENHCRHRRTFHRGFHLQRSSLTGIWLL